MVKLTDDVKESLSGTKLVYLATSSQDRVPNVVPIAAFRILDDGTMLISDQFFNKTLQNMKENPKIALSWWGDKGGFQIKGTVTIHTNDEIFGQDVAWMKDHAFGASVEDRSDDYAQLAVQGPKAAGIVQVKEFSDFDWTFNPKIPKAKMIELATARFVPDHRNVLLIGPPGIGKSFAATAIAVGAIRAGYRVLIRSAFDLAQDFAEAEATGERRELVQTLIRVDLLILEDFGMKKLGPSAAEDLLEVFVRRHEAGSILITTNRPTEDWGQFLGDVPAATAILDRFLAHAEIVPMQGKSYRLHQRARRGAGGEEGMRTP